MSGAKKKRPTLGGREEGGGGVKFRAMRGIAPMTAVIIALFCLSFSTARAKMERS